MNKKQLKQKRKEILLELLNQIENGEFSSKSVDLQKMFEDANISPRRSYLSPLERSTYNYGYMDMGEQIEMAPTNIDMENNYEKKHQ